MARDYTIKKSRTTGWWRWDCKDGSSGGTAITKKDAKEQAKEACSSSGFELTPPKIVHTKYINGYLSSFVSVDLDEKENQFSVGEIEEDSFDFYFGFHCPTFNDLDPAKRLITLLKIWGIFVHPVFEESALRTTYNLSDSNFQRLINKDYEVIEVSIDDENQFQWHIN